MIDKLKNWMIESANIMFDDSKSDLRSLPKTVRLQILIVLSFIWSTVFSLYVFSLTTFIFAMPFLMLMPLYVTEVLDSGPATLGLILSLPGFLSVAGSLFAASLGDFPYKGRLLFIAVLSPCIAAVVLSQTSFIWATILATCFYGALSSQYAPSSRSAVMKATPEDMRGRVSSLLALNMGWSSVGMMFYGLLADVGGIQLSYLVFGGIALILNISLFLGSKAYRNMS